jgi:hypothetical protein
MFSTVPSGLTDGRHYAFGDGRGVVLDEDLRGDHMKQWLINRLEIHTVF